MLNRSVDDIETTPLPLISDGDADAALAAVMDFLRKVSHQLLATFPEVQRWDQTDDVFQHAAIRLHRALQETTLNSRRHLENLAALQVRRTLIDLGRKYATMSKTRWTPIDSNENFCGISDAVAFADSNPDELIEWVELHEQIDLLPDDLKEVFQLIWYRGLSKEQVAKLLNVDLRSIQRRWRAAREVLSQKLSGAPRR